MPDPLWIRLLIQLDACSPALKWARTQPSYAAAWRNCPKREWLAWLLTTVHDRCYCFACTNFYDANDLRKHYKRPSIEAIRRAVRFWTSLYRVPERRPL